MIRNSWGLVAARVSKESNSLRKIENGTDLRVFVVDMVVVSSEWRSLRVTDDNSKDLQTGHGGDLTMTAELHRKKAVPPPTTCA